MNWLQADAAVKMYRALSVAVLDDRIKGILEQHDPMLLRQIKDARAAALAVGLIEFDGGEPGGRIGETVKVIRPEASGMAAEVRKAEAEAKAAQPTTKRYAVAMNGQTGAFEVHKAGCADLSKPRKRMEYTGRPWIVDGPSGAAVLEGELREMFSDATEHPAKDGYEGGTYGAAGFGGRVFPCCEDAGKV